MQQKIVGKMNSETLDSKNPGLPMSEGLDATKLGCLAAEDGG